MRAAVRTSDTGTVWLTEAIEAQRESEAVDSVRLPPEDSVREEVAYATCAVGDGARAGAAARYLAFLALKPIP